MQADDTEDEGEDEAVAIGDVREDRWNVYDVEALSIQPPVQEMRRDDRPKTAEDLLPIFTGQRVGLNAQHNARVSPGDFFAIFWTADLMSTFVKNTNEFATQSNQRRWREVTVPEMKTFFAIVLRAGIYKVPERSMTWDPTHGSMFVRQMMTMTRFEDILRNLHWHNAYGVNAEERKRKNKENSFWTVQSFFDDLATSCRGAYNPPQKIDVDEQCFDFKGRHGARCFNKSKPAKYHFKNFAMNCSLTGFMCNFFMYVGKDMQRYGGYSATEYPPMRLSDHYQYQNKNHIMATDNWYTSVKLALALMHIGIFLIGTIKGNREGLPKNKVIKKKGVHPRGFMQCMTGTFPYLLGTHELWFTAWVDNKPVHMLSTIPLHKSHVDRVHKDARGNYTGKAPVEIPTVVMTYNTAMGGTDLMDQMISYYKTKIRTRRWQTRIYFHFLNAMVVNAHILFKSHFQLEREDDNFTLLSFMTALIGEWATPQIPVQESAGGRFGKGQTRVFRTGVHTPMCLSRDRDADGYERDIRRACKSCSKKVASKCQECDVFVCFGDGINTSCCEKFHSHLVER